MRTCLPAIARHLNNFTRRLEHLQVCALMRLYPSRSPGGPRIMVPSDQMEVPEVLREGGQRRLLPARAAGRQGLRAFPP